MNEFDQSDRLTDSTAQGPEGPGARIGHYRLVKLIGEGGFGEVYEAEQLEPVKRRVAIKLIIAGMNTREVIARFDAERQALAIMDHPHIAKVLDAGATPRGRPYFVMELVDGTPMTEYCDRHRLTIDERLRLFEQVCLAVQHAHTKGVIHRDLKPSNVLVSTHEDQPFAKIIDFGIAKAVSGRLTDRTLLTRQHQLVGTPLYMSPEQAAGSIDIDTRADVYALGALLYELLTGTTPFSPESLQAASLAEMQRIIREVEPLRPSARLSESIDTLYHAASSSQSQPRRLTKTIRGELDWIVMKALEKERERRYDSANGLAQDIRRYLSGQPVQAAPPERIYRLRKLIGRNKLLVSSGAALATALLVGIVAFAWQARIAQQRADELEQVSRFQADMLAQIDPTAAGILLTKDLTAKLQEGLTKRDIPEAERNTQIDAFRELWAHINATDAARDLIDQTILKPAAKVIDQQFQLQPAVAATLQQALSDRYVELGLYDAALPLQQKALILRRSVLGDDHPSTLDAMSGMGVLQHSLGNLSDADPYLQGALQNQRTILGNNDLRTVGSMLKLAILRRDQGNFAEAQTLFDESATKYRQIFGSDHPDTLEAINQMGSCLYMQGKLNDAEPLWRDVLQRRRQTLGNDHHATLASINNWGTLLYSQGKLSEAEPFYREVLAKGKALLGDEHPDTLYAMNNLGALLYAQGKLAEAEPFWREAMEKRLRVLGPSNPQTIMSISDMGVLLRAAGRPSEGEPLAREALAKFNRVLGPDHPHTLYATYNLAVLLRAENELDEAETYAVLALSESRRVFGTEHADTLIALTELGALRVAQQRFADAKQLLEPALAATQSTFTNSNSHRAASLLVNLGAAETGLGEFTAAEHHLLDAHEIYRQFPGPTPTGQRECVTAIADLYRAWNSAQPDAGYDAKSHEWQTRLANGTELN